MTDVRKSRTVFICQECGQESLKWLGRCPDCQTWNSFVERVERQGAGVAPVAAPVEICELADEELARLVIDLPEFNRVLGGGIVPGSLILVGGDPGIGKSTLMLQAAVLAARDRRRVLYISAEESAQQLKMRARRLTAAGEGIFLLSETNLDGALQEADALQPSLMVVDSIQTVYTAAAPSPPGSIGQLRECTMRLMRWAKSSGVPTCIVGHVTKEGDIAGPRLLEHIVDVVLYLEGERFSSYRLLRGVKNRFGSTNEVGVFEMTGEGLIGVENPSEVFLAERAEGAVGSVVVPTLEGSRPLLVEVQALTSPTMLATPRRTANGLDLNRLILVCAVLTRRAGLALGNQDIIANVVGGLRVHEPAADLGLALAIASSYRDAALSRDLVAIGEVGLSGELRSVSQMERRLAEAERLGFARCLLPQAALRRGAPTSGMQLLPAASLREAIRLAFA
ncbi:MAG: DNA repair protein RadA [Dehalococcoidia bacterium]|nr:MAG: DNA repair protein RadA [Dehalococcoidia bacterium]